jgi:hypothetical protein
MVTKTPARAGRTGDGRSSTGRIVQAASELLRQLRADQGQPPGTARAA